MKVSSRSRGAFAFSMSGGSKSSIPVLTGPLRFDQDTARAYKGTCPGHHRHHHHRSDLLSESSTGGAYQVYQLSTILHGAVNWVPSGPAQPLVPGHAPPGKHLRILVMVRSGRPETSSPRPQQPPRQGPRPADHDTLPCASIGPVMMWRVTCRASLGSWPQEEQGSASGKRTSMPGCGGGGGSSGLGFGRQNEARCIIIPNALCGSSTATWSIHAPS